MNTTARMPHPKMVPLLLLSVVLLPLAGCGEKEGASKSTDKGPAEARHGLTAEEAAKVLAKVGTTTVTVGDFADRLAEQSPYLRARYNSPERRKEYLDNLIRFELLAEEARRRGFFEADEVKRAEKQMMIQEMMRKDFDSKFTLASITDAEVKAHYEKHLNEYQKPAQVRLSHILVKDRALAEKIIAELKAGKDDSTLFKRLAEAHSIDAESKDVFGDTGFHTLPKERSAGETSTLPDAVIEAGFSLQANGDLYDKPVASDRGFHIVRLTAKRDALARGIEEVRRSIQHQIRREKRDAAVEALVAELRKKAEVKEDWSRLKDVKFDAPAEVQGATSKK
ncbi:MAG: peptidyl-prolyl cis-trans isomerase [Myxococcales bacterium]|nr:peptidyl-prolyl cis-trans isomerase [Myxococcales bacterium]